MVQLRRLLILCLMALCLTGCVDYDIGLRFDHQTHGTLTQTLHLDERFTQLNQAQTQQWLTQFEKRARALSARVKRLDAASLQVTLPFYNDDDLVAKFNTLFSDSETSLLKDVPGLPPLSASLNLEQQNRFLALRNHLVYDLDLRPLSTLPVSNKGVIGNLKILNLSFHLITPWGIQSLSTPQNAMPITQGHDTSWQLKPGELNHIEVVFWIPSPIGIGLVVIILLVVGGDLVKRRFFQSSSV